MDEPLIMVVRKIVAYTDNSSDHFMETTVRWACRWDRVKRRWASKHWHRVGDVMIGGIPDDSIEKLARELGVYAAETEWRRR